MRPNKNYEIRITTIVNDGQFTVRRLRCLAVHSSYQEGRREFWISWSEYYLPCIKEH